MTGALAGLKVVEIGSSAALAYCGKLFADFGAEVVIVEPPGGGSRRQAWPLVEIGGGRRESGVFAWLATNKQSVVLDPDRAEDAAVLEALFAWADVLIDARADTTGLHARLQAVRPELTIVALSWFGESGPYRDFRANDFVCRALAGLVRLTGAAEGPPEMLSLHQAAIVGGLTAFTAALSARLSKQPGRRFELSLHEANAVLAEYQAAVAASVKAAGEGAAERRYGRNRFRPTFPLGIHPCREGWIGVTIITPDQWAKFCALLEMKEPATDPRFATNLGRFEHADELEPIYAGRFLAKTAAEWFALGRALKLPFVIVPDVPTLLAQQVHRGRGAFALVRIGEAVFEAPAVPFPLTRAPAAANGAAPLAGEHTAQWRGRAAKGAVPSRPAPTRRPLDGVRVVDLTMGWAGPLATRQLADLGAEILKVEGCAYPDWWRGVDHSEDNVRHRLYEQSLWFNVMNRNKRGVAIDLTVPRGVELVKRLVAKADAVIENYSQEVLPKLGLDYAALRRCNETLVMVSMPAFGDTEWRDVRAYGSTLEQASGLPIVTGPPDAPPTHNQLAYGDPVGGLNGAAALLTALMHRKRTGEGQHVDLSQVQGMLPLLGPWIIEHGVTGRVTRFGNRHPDQAPHGCFQCRGDDAWVALAVTEDAQWPSLCALLGRDDLASLASVEDRRALEDRIEQAVASWTATRDAEDAMARLQAAGIAAGVVRSPGEIYDDPHLRARGVWQSIERPWIGRHDQPSAPFREGGKPYDIMAPAPTLGQHNEFVFRGMLGMSEADFAALTEAGVIGAEAIPVGKRRKRAA